jgi:hypothetical protein
VGDPAGVPDHVENMEIQAGLAQHAAIQNGFGGIYDDASLALGGDCSIQVVLRIQIGG